MCYILGNKPSTVEKFSIVCIILSSANIKGFIHFSSSVTGVPNERILKMSKIVALLRTSAFKSYGHFEECFFVKSSFKISSNNSINSFSNCLT